MSATGDVADMAISDIDFEDLKPTIEKFSDVGPELRKILYEHNSSVMEREFLDAEEKIGMKREYVLCLVSGILALYLIFGEEAGFLCNLIGFTYPAGASIMALNNRSKAEAMNWLCYWTQFGFFVLIDSYVETINTIFPFYWITKTFILLYLMLPQTRGAQRLHLLLIGPQYAKIREFIQD